MLAKIKSLLYLAIPVLITQVSIVGMNTLDTIMTGNYNAVHLAGTAIAVGILMPVFTGLGGVLSGITPILAHLLGAKKQNQISEIIMQSFLVASALAVLVIILGTVFIDRILDLMSLDLEVRTVAYSYLQALSFGVIPCFLNWVMRGFIDAQGQTRLTMILFLCALPINACLNYILIFGKFGMPELGGVGAGYATSITYYLLFIAFIFTIKKVDMFNDYNIFSQPIRPNFSKWLEIVKFGIPIGLAVFAETSIFGFTTLIMSKFGTVTIAAFQAANTVSSLMYMFPMSFSMALTIIVGWNVGAKKYQDAKVYSYLGILVAMCFGIVLSSCITVFRGEIALLYSNELFVRNITESFLVLVVFFQLGDAIGTPLQGILRGYKDVRYPLFVAVFAYWCIAFPAGYYMDNVLDFGSRSYWYGFIVAIAFTIILLAFRLVKKQKTYSSMQTS